MKNVYEKIARFIHRHPVWCIVIAAVISVAAIPGITMLEPDTGYGALINDNAEVWIDTSRYEAEFGGDSVNIMAEGDIEDIFSATNLQALGRFEQNVLADPRFRSVSSPLSILRLAVEEAEAAAQEAQQQVALALEQAAKDARDQAAAAGMTEEQQEMAAEQAKLTVLQELQPQIDALEQMGEISIDNPVFINSVIFDEDGNINPVMKNFLPDTEHALIIVIPEGNMNDAAKLEATRFVEPFLDDVGFSDLEFTIVSHPEVIDAISVGLANNLKILLGLSVATMIVILFVLFRVRWRLLSLLMVGVSALWTFGLMGWIGIPLTMTSMAVLPILIGLGIDFSIQFHNRYQEEIIRSHDVKDAVITSVSRMLPVVGIALLSTIVGFITLFISEVPMIRDFGLVLAIGIFFSYLVGLFLLNAIIVLAERNVPLDKLQTSAAKAGKGVERFLGRLGKLAIEHTAWILVISVLFAGGGAFVDHLLPVNTDYEQLMQQNSGALKDLRDFREIVGAGGSIYFMVEADAVDSPEALTWMNDFQEEIVRSHDEILATTNMAALVTDATEGIIPSQDAIDMILAAAPKFSLDRMISADHTMASIAFTIKYISVEDLHDLINEIMDGASPPAGVEVSPVGSMVIGAKTMDAVVGSRMTLNLICLGAIFLILLIVYRRIDRTLFSVIPVGAVIAWSSLDMFITGIPLNPLTAILGVIVIGICTEFMVLLTGRYEEEKSNGLAPKEAMITAIARTGRAIITTSVTTIGGFAVLIVSDFVMIRDFGIVTLIGVILCLIISVTVMPGVIVWYDLLRLRRKKSE